MSNEREDTATTTAIAGDGGLSEALAAANAKPGSLAELDVVRSWLRSSLVPAPAGQRGAPVAALTDEEIDAITKKHITHLGGWEWSGDIIDVSVGNDYDFARDIEAEVARRFRAQGGITSQQEPDNG